MKTNKKDMLRHLNTAILLLEGIKESIENPQPGMYDDYSREDSPEAIKRRCIQVRQEVLRVYQDVNNGGLNEFRKG